MFTRLNTELANRPRYPLAENDNTLLSAAIAAAAKSSQRFRVGAACYGNERNTPGIITDWNTKELHAEAALCASINYALRNTTVAVVRLGRLHDWRCSFPCPNCHALLRRQGFRRLLCFDENGHPVSLNL